MIDKQLAARFKKFQKKTGKYPEFKLDAVEFEVYQLEDVYLSFNKGKTPTYSDTQTDIQVIKSGQAKGYYNKFDFSKPQYLKLESYNANDDKNLQKGDLLINTTGKGTAGRVTLFDLSGKYVADSHIGILRFDKEKIDKFYILSYFVSIGFSNLEKMAEGSGGQIELQRNTINKLEIPIPKSLNATYTSLKIQEILVEFIDYYQSESSRKLVVVDKIEVKITEIERALLPIFFSKHPSVCRRFDKFCKKKGVDLKLKTLEFDTEKLSDLATITMGQSPDGSNINTSGKGLPFHQGKTGYGDRYIKEATNWTENAKKIAEKDDILISMRAPAGAVNIASYRTAIGRGLASIRPNEAISDVYLY